MRCRRSRTSFPSPAALPQPVPDPAPAFRIWSQTALAEARLTSGRGAVRPERTAHESVRAELSRVRAGRTDLQLRERRLHVGSVRRGVRRSAAEERRMLHAERGVCVGGAVSGRIVVHVMLDYRALPFISSPSPYFEVFRASAGDERRFPRHRPGHLRVGADAHLCLRRGVANRRSPVPSNLRIASAVLDDAR